MTQLFSAFRPNPPRRLYSVVHRSNCRWEVDFLPIPVPAPGPPPVVSLGGKLWTTLGTARETSSGVGESSPGVRGPLPAPAPAPTYRAGELGLREAGDDGEKGTPPAAPLEVAADAGDETAPWAMETSGADDARSRLAAAAEGDEELSSTILIPSVAD